MNQPITIKRVGDFYEAFDEDAKTLARTLGLTLTSRQGRAMAGFPYHQLDLYAKKLQASGLEVTVEETQCS